MSIGRDTPGINIQNQSGATQSVGGGDILIPMQTFGAEALGRASENVSNNIMKAIGMVSDARNARLNRESAERINTADIFAKRQLQDDKLAEERRVESQKRDQSVQAMTLANKLKTLGEGEIDIYTMSQVEGLTAANPELMAVLATDYKDVYKSLPNTNDLKYKAFKQYSSLLANPNLTEEQKNEALARMPQFDPTNIAEFQKKFEKEKVEEAKNKLEVQKTATDIKNTESVMQNRADTYKLDVAKYKLDVAKQAQKERQDAIDNQWKYESRNSEVYQKNLKVYQERILNDPQENSRFVNTVAPNLSYDPSQLQRMFPKATSPKTAADVDAGYNLYMKAVLSGAGSDKYEAAKVIVKNAGITGKDAQTYIDSAYAAMTGGSAPSLDNNTGAVINASAWIYANTISDYSKRKDLFKAYQNFNMPK